MLEDFFVESAVTINRRFFAQIGANLALDLALHSLFYW